MTLDLTIASDVRRLTLAEKTQFEHEGYVRPLPALAPEGVHCLQSWFLERTASIPDDIDISKVNNWHKASRTFYDICRTPAILDYVEDVLDPILSSGAGNSSSSIRAMARWYPGIKMPNIGPSTPNVLSPFGWQYLMPTKPMVP